MVSPVSNERARQGHNNKQILLFYNENWKISQTFKNKTFISQTSYIYLAMGYRLHTAQKDKFGS